MVNILLWALAGGTTGWIGFSFVAFACAAAVLTVSNMVHKRFGF